MTSLKNHTPDDNTRVDARLDSPQREGLTGTTPANVYKSSTDVDTISLPPDGRAQELQPQWRRDFPIDWPEDHYVARRDFTKFLVLTSAAMVAGQLWIAAQNWWRRRQGEVPIRKVAALTELPIGTSKVFRYPGPHDDCVIVRIEEHALVAYSQKCTHLSCAVVPRPEKGVIHCPCHEGLFDLRTGAVLSGPPPRPLPRIKLEIHGDDVYATGVELRTV